MCGASHCCEMYFSSLISHSHRINVSEFDVFAMETVFLFVCFMLEESLKCFVCITEFEYTKSQFAYFCCYAKILRISQTGLNLNERKIFSPFSNEIQTSFASTQTNKRTFSERMAFRMELSLAYTSGWNGQTMVCRTLKCFQICNDQIDC